MLTVDKLPPFPRKVPENLDIKTCCSAEDLHIISNPEVSLAIWQNEKTQKLVEWFDGLDPEQLPDFRILVDTPNVHNALAIHLEEMSIYNKDMYDLLLTDIEKLVSIYSKLTKVDTIDIRLECVSHDACWKFHRDNVDLRLLKTYRGPATEWVPNAYANEAIIEQKDYSGPLNQLMTNDVTIFKGSRDKTNCGIVHRSPPIAGTEQIRLLLCLNQPSAASPSLWTPA